MSQSGVLMCLARLFVCREMILLAMSRCGSKVSVSGKVVKLCRALVIVRFHIVLLMAMHEPTSRWMPLVN